MGNVKSSEMLKFMVLVLGLMLGFALTNPAGAAVCRQSHDHVICIVTIQRSAKNYWEYRAIVSVDGVKQPLAVYNCRDRIRINSEGTIEPFQSAGAGDLICGFFSK